MERTRPRARRTRPAAIAGWLAAGVLGLTSTAEASVYTSGCASSTACTFHELLAGGTITAGFQRFASFAIEQDPGSLDWTRVIVTGRDDAGLDPGPPSRSSTMARSPRRGPTVWTCSSPTRSRR